MGPISEYVVGVRTNPNRRKPMEKYTIERAAKDAIACQDACNASGVLHDLDRIMTEVIFPSCGDTEERNRHPIMILFLHKLCSLAGIETDVKSFGKAYGQCFDLANSK